MPNLIDLTGQRFGMWTVIQRAETSKAGQTRWLCRCDCGTAKAVQGCHLRGGKSICCGCENNKRLSEWNRTAKRKHGGAIHSNRDRLYAIWSSAKGRCFTKTDKQYKNYGARGITVCDEWLGENGYENFRTWAYANGYDENAPRSKCTLDRIDVNGNYEPSNCRFADAVVQCNNKRNNHWLEYNGERHTVSEWSRIVGLTERQIQARLYEGWSTERTLTQPLRKW